MKTLLGVYQYGENDIRFKTDMDIRKDLNEVINLVPLLAFAMITSLWGGNETSVLAIIRALAIADLGVSINRKEMISFFDRESQTVARAVQEATQEMQKTGKIIAFPPGIGPSKIRS